MEDFYAIPFAQLCNARGEALDDAALPVLELLHVHVDVGDLDSVLLGLASGGDDVRGVDESLRGDAPVVQAFPAKTVPLDEEDPLPQLGCADCGRVSAGSRADHEDVDGPGHARRKAGALKRVGPRSKRGGTLAKGFAGPSLFVATAGVTTNMISLQRDG